MRRLFVPCLAALALASATAPAVFAAEDHGHQSMEGHEKMETMPAAWTDGEVRKIEKDAGKLTLRHGEVKNLDMQAMTMAWKVKDPAMLNDLKVGDKLRFTAQKIDGQFTITAIEPAN